MVSSTNPLKTMRKSRLLLLAALFLVALIVAYQSAKYFAARMIDDPDLAPPLVQIRSQAKQLSEQRLDDVIPDADVGFVLPPNLNQQVRTYDFEFQRVTDEFGFVNRGAWPDQADVVFLGDSLIMAEGVGLENGFVALIGDSFSDKTILNLGNPGAGLERQYRIFDKFATDLDPRLVVACFYISSDLTNDTHFLEWLEKPLDLSYNRFRLSYSRRKNQGSRGTLLWRMRNHILYEWALSFIEPRLWGEREIEHRRRMPDGEDLLFNRETVKFARKSFDGNEVEFENFYASLDRLQMAAENLNTSLVFMLLPSKEEIFAEDVVVRHDSAVGVLKEELDRRGIAYLDLYPLLQDAGRRRTPFFVRDAHMNGHGNKVVADAFTRWVPVNQTER